MPPVASPTERLGSRHAEEDPRSDRAFCTAMVGIVDGAAARLILRSGRATHPVPGSRGHFARKRPRHPDRTSAETHQTTGSRNRSLRLQTAVVIFRGPLARWGADSRGIPIPTLHVFVYSVTARGLRLPSMSARRLAGRRRSVEDLLPQPYCYRPGAGGPLGRRSGFWWLPGGAQTGWASPWQARSWTWSARSATSWDRFAR